MIELCFQRLGKVLTRFHFSEPIEHPAIAAAKDAVLVAANKVGEGMVRQCL